MAEDVSERPVIDVRQKLAKADRYGPSRLISVFPIDNADGTFELMYVFQHNEQEVVIHRYTIPAGAEIESLTDLYKGALNMEREAVDLFGVKFKGIEPGLFLTEGSPRTPLLKPPKQKETPPQETKEAPKDA